jgi:hypothetical protein
MKALFNETAADLSDRGAPSPKHALLLVLIHPVQTRVKAIETGIHTWHSKEDEYHHQWT